MKSSEKISGRGRGDRRGPGGCGAHQYVRPRRHPGGGRHSKPDWIIVGRKGLSGIERLLMGSVTSRVIGSSPCHVLVVPRETKLEFKKILIAHDGSIFGESAWRQATKLAERANSEVIAVSVARNDLVNQNYKWSCNTWKPPRRP